MMLMRGTNLVPCAAAANVPGSHMRFITTNKRLVSSFIAVASAILVIGVVTACAPSGGESAAPATTVTATTTAVTRSTVTTAATETVSVAPVTITVTESAAPAAANSVAPEAPTGGGAAGPFTDGQYVIGVDIQAGTYRGGGPACYWARLSGTSGGMGELLTNYFGDGPTVVTIKSTDVAFETSDCGEWTIVQ